MLEVTGLGGAGPIYTAACFSPPNGRSAHPDPAGHRAPRGTRRLPDGNRSSRLQHGAPGDLASRHVPPERDEKLPRHRDDGGLADPAAFAAHAVVEPAAEGAARLVPEPLPGKLDHGPAQARVAGLRDPLLMVEDRK